MSLPQAIVMAIMSAAIHSVFMGIVYNPNAEVYNARPDNDGLIPVNRKIMDAIAAGRL